MDPLFANPFAGVCDMPEERREKRLSRLYKDPLEASKGGTSSISEKRITDRHAESDQYDWHMAEDSLGVATIVSR